MRFSNKRNGFSLIELLIVIAIIGLLAAVVMAVVGDGRKKARDAQRISDISQIQVALRVYLDANGEYPDFDGGVTVGEGSAFDTQMAEFFPKVPGDPLGGPTVTAHEYFYGSDVHCNALDNSKRYIVVFARTMETTANANWATVCNSPSGAGSDGNPTATTYGVVLGVVPD